MAAEEPPVPPGQGRPVENDRGTRSGNRGSSIRTQEGIRAKSITLAAPTISAVDPAVSKVKKGILPDDGYDIGRSNNRPWGAAMMGQPLEKLTARSTPPKGCRNYGNMISSPSGRWLWWRLHVVKSKILCCHCRPTQPCHGDCQGIRRSHGRGETARRSSATSPWPQSLRSR